MQSIWIFISFQFLLQFNSNLFNGFFFVEIKGYDTHIHYFYPIEYTKYFTINQYE